MVIYRRYIEDIRIIWVLSIVVLVQSSTIQIRIGVSHGIINSFGFDSQFQLRISVLRDFSPQ